MIDTVKFFKEKKYVLIKEMIPRDIAKVATQYSHYDRARLFQPEAENAQIPGSHSVYGDPLMETLLNFGRKSIEKSTGLELWPTYSYYRLYKVGDMLKRHKDRPSCEVSVSLHCSNNLDYGWPIWFDTPDGDKIPLVTNPGDAVIYKGCEREHWREPMKGDHKSYYHQIFFHYVLQDGQRAHCAWDRAR